MGICLFDGSDEFVLARGQVHRLYVEAFGFVLVVASDDDHRNVGFRAASVAAFRSFARASGVSWAGSSPSMPTPSADVI